MAIIGVTPVSYQKFSGYEDPGLPSGFWFANGVVIGDATGGTQVAQINIAEATNQFNSQYYSLEAISITLARAANFDLRLAIFNMDRVFEYTITLSLNATASNMLPRDTEMLPLYIGQAGLANTAAGLSFALPNVDTDLLSVHVEGYVWSARSTSVPGGPRRPSEGLYSR